MFDWRLHVWSRVTCQNGPVISLVVRGELQRLTDREREFLNEVATAMTHLQRPAKERMLPGRA